MTNQQLAAMEQALEAMNLARSEHGQILLSDPPQEAWKAWRVSDALTKAMTAASEALAEQPAQQRPQNCGTGYCSCIECLFDPEQPAQQQEPVITKNEKGLTLHVGWDDLPAGTKLYTSPPASKPWVGLTDEEMRDLEKQFNAERVRTSDEEYLVIYPGDYWAWQRAIEAKLREKNA